MKYIILPGTDLKISRVALGTLWLAGIDENEVIPAIHCAFDQGIKMIDTAENYLGGKSEEIVGKAVAGRRDKVVIATKGGLDWGQHTDRAPRSTELHINMAGQVSNQFRNSNPAWITAAIDSSLRRMNTDYIDLYQIHYPNTTTPWEDTIDALEKAKAAGKIRYYGLSNFSVPQMREWLEHSSISSVQPPYNMLTRDIEDDILPFCIENKIGVLTYGSLAHGLLTGTFNKDNFPSDWRKELKPFKGDAYAKNLTIIEKLKEFGAARGIRMTQLAAAWVLAQPGVSAALIAVDRTEHVEDNIKSTEIELSQEDLSYIRKILEFRD